MGKLVDYKCEYVNYRGFSADYVSSLGLDMPGIFTEAAQMAAYAKAEKSRLGEQVVKLPFDTFAIGEALGAAIIKDSSPLGIRKEKSIISDIEEIVALPEICLENSRISEIFKACDILRNSGEKVALQIRGLSDTLNSFMEVQDIMMAMLKKPEEMQKACDKIRKDIIAYADEAQKHCDIMFYEDSSGGINIIGPKLARKTVEWFTYPLIKELESMLCGSMKLAICPKTAFMLTGCDRADFTDYEAASGGTYYDICFNLPEDIKLLGQICNRRLNEKWDGPISYIRLK